MTDILTFIKLIEARLEDSNSYIPASFANLRFPIDPNGPVPISLGRFEDLPKVDKTVKQLPYKHIRSLTKTVEDNSFINIQSFEKEGRVIHIGYSGITKHNLEDSFRSAICHAILQDISNSKITEAIARDFLSMYSLKQQDIEAFSEKTYQTFGKQAAAIGLQRFKIYATAADMLRTDLKLHDKTVVKPFTTQYDPLITYLGSLQG